MARVSMRELREDVKRLRRWTGVNYQLDIAYGRPKVVLVEPERGSQADLSPRLATGQLQKWIYAFLSGIEQAKRLPELRRKYPAEDVERPIIRNPRRRKEWEEYRISHDPKFDEWTVQGFGYFPESSVLAGQPRTMILDTFGTLEEAQSAYPTAEVTGERWPTTREMQVGPSVLPPSDFDPMAAGERWEEDY